ncbi:TrkA family potassium uptake protein [Blastococcus sp. Marseille-P5729]|uniref:potassium channel family protein n=1 Tax=Blastococcus sp. Marseille-P5729 TaxID=2086582 RepID=UPI001F28B7D0|nr:NAD(P)-binding protein [Blastococcus sp. Marseille-P5729]
MNPIPLDRAVLRLPERALSPVRSLGVRIGVAFLLVAIVVLAVYVDRDGYRDADGDAISLLDAVYYTTVTMTTTGYGDITPVSESARLVNVLLITPLRIMFLILLVGTTLEVLATEGRERMRLARWRKNMRNHVVVVGYGTKGRSAVTTLVGAGVDQDRILVIDPSESASREAQADGLASIVGDASRRDVLERAHVDEAKKIIVTANRDDTAVLVVLTARQLNAEAHIIASVREQGNVHLLRQSGANNVVTSSESVGRMLAIASVNPSLADVLDDMLSPGVGLEVAERDIHPDEIGRSPKWCSDQVVAVVRGGKSYRYFDNEVTALEDGDTLVVVRDSKNAPEREKNSY